VSPAPGATRGFTGLASLFRARNSTGTIAEATTWLQLSVRGFLRAERRSDGREPSDVLRWLNAGSPASPPPINGRTAVARPSPAQRIFNPKDHQ